ncbi:EAL domain-containing protein [Azonexus sp.]|uniref:EAL domain-containing protein n=1 Tax=Azonexus sp. TaxID=1872668 RepID=UPI0027B96569|nr:EAL domain-containing protein [Azonexus sp.]
MFVLLRGNLLLALFYALTGWLALQIAIPPGYAAPLFPPAGIALAAMLIYGPRCQAGIFAGALTVQAFAAVQSGLGANAWPLLVLPTLGALLQAWVGYVLAGRLLGRDNPLDSHESIVRFVLLVAPSGALIGATIGTLTLHAMGILSDANSVFSWVNWWVGDTLGVLVMVPLLLVFLGQPAAEWRSRRVIVTVPMLIALSVLAATFLQVSHWEERRLQSQLNRDAEHIASLIRKRLDAQLDQMLALERLATVHPQLDARTWREFVTPLLERYPGTQNFGWSPLVLDADRATFEAAIRASGLESFRILGRNPAGQTYVAEQRPEYLPILHVEPLSSNRSVIGLDPLVLEKTAQAARRTRETRLPIASSSIRLVQESGEQRGVVVYHAVFSGSPLRQTGMVSGVFRMDDALNAALAGAWAGLDVCLVDLEHSGVEQRLFGDVACEDGRWVAHRLHWQDSLGFAGRQWVLKVAATEDYMAGLRTWGAWLMLAIGLLSTAMLGAFLLLTSGRTRRVERLVEERTRQLAEAGNKLEARQEELLQAQRIARLGSWEILPDSTFCHCSAELRSIMGLGDEALIDLPELIEHVHPDDRGALRNVLDELASAPGQVALDCRLSDLVPRAGIVHFRIESDRQASGGLRIRGTAQDVTRARAAEEHIAFLAHYDVLTGLPNRTQWNDRAHVELNNAARQDERLAVLFLDLDHFKAVNDSLGHPVGDQLLSAVARRFSNCLREQDFLARLGGDEFVVMLTRLEHPEDAAIVARKLIATLQTPILIEGHELTAAASIGIAIFPDDGEDVSTLLKHADVAMYCAKDQGRNTYHYFMPEMDVHALERLMLENALRRAIERNELVLHYQPQVAADDGRALGCEALVRWQHPELGMLQPAQFIGVAEESGLIVALGKWVLQTACQQLAAWTAEGQRLVMAVNISALQFRQNGFSETVQRIVEQTGADPALLELELTESALMQPTPEVLARMNHLCDLGIRLALDDFGTGYSSLSYLKRLPICRLKLDRSFVKDIPDDLEDVAIAMATLSLARDLGMDVVAEGVETEIQRAFLAERACPVMQGYLFSRPLPAEAFLQWVRERQAG